MSRNGRDAVAGGGLRVRRRLGLVAAVLAAGACNGSGLPEGVPDGSGEFGSTDAASLDRPCVVTVVADDFDIGGPKRFGCAFERYSQDVTPDTESVVLIQAGGAGVRFGAGISFPRGRTLTGTKVTFDQLAQSALVDYFIPVGQVHWATQAPLNRSSAILTEAVLGDPLGPDPGIAHGSIDAVLDPAGWSNPAMPHVTLHVDF